LVKCVACIGAGTIGASWAANFLFAGLDVVASDPAPEGEAFARRYVGAAWATLEKIGSPAAGASPDRLRFVRDPAEAVAEAEFVQESGPEREDLKVDLIARLDAAAPAETVIASSSSGFLVSAMQGRCRHPERIVLGHPFNPPHLIPLVEVVGGARTSPAAVERALAFYRQAGKRPIHIRKEVKGHVANRLQAALWREAVHLVAEGVCSVEDVDAAIAHGPGLRWALMGPHLTFALAGGEGGMKHFMEHLAVPLQGWWQDLGDPKLTPELQQKIVAGVEDEMAGRSVKDVARWRDEALVEILGAAKRAHAKA
jgi:3-hydroxyacyl-CoA dehydrogenase